MENRLNTPPYRPDINDPVALKVSWKPFAVGAASFATHKINQPFASKIEFKATNLVIGFYSMFILWGLGLIMLGFYEPSVIIIGVFIMTFAIWAMKYGTAPFVLDKKSGFFWRGYKKPDNYNKDNKIKTFGQLADIHALQLAKQVHTHSEGGSYYTHELNLVLKNAKRVNIINFRGKDKVIDDAKKLAQFLNVPLWDVEVKINTKVIVLDI